MMARRVGVVPVVLVLALAAPGAHAQAHDHEHDPDPDQAQTQDRGDADRLDHLIGSWQVSLGLGAPDFLTVGLSRTFADHGWRAGARIGSIVLASYGSVQIDRLIVQLGPVRLYALAKALGFVNHNLIGEYTPGNEWSGGVGPGLGIEISAGPLAFTSEIAPLLGTWVEPFVQPGFFPDSATLEITLLRAGVAW